ncbi:hypothetical protein HMPREF3038_01850 [Akkermansia sp. KLE1797]|nr:hypothetical protein HMPREF3038_01850 [Akkermansia sp. KLE1797]
MLFFSDGETSFSCAEKAIAPVKQTADTEARKTNFQFLFIVRQRVGYVTLPEIPHRTQQYYAGFFVSMGDDQIQGVR